MTPEPLVFDPVRAGMNIGFFGYHHVSKDTDRAVLEEFVKNNGLEIQEGSEFTVTLVPAGYKGGSGTDWEAIRQENLKRRQKAAAAKKRKAV